MSTFLEMLGLDGIFGDKSKNSSRIFISYRRDDSRGDAGRLTDDLKKFFGPNRTFRDIETIEPGMDFVDALNRAVSQCPVLLAIIGPNWLSAKDGEGHRRLDDSNDFIRLEIGTALTRNTRVIPVLVGGATMPKAEQLPVELQPLARRQAYELSDRRWEFDVDQLVQSLESILGPRLKKDPPATPWWKNKKKIAWVAAAGVIGVIASLYQQQSEQLGLPTVPPQPVPVVSALNYAGFDAIGRYPTIVQVYSPG
jgi:hypothetical protein